MKNLDSPAQLEVPANKSVDDIHNIMGSQVARMPMKHHAEGNKYQSFLRRT